MTGEWWVPVLQWSLWGLAMFVTMGWVARSRFRVDPDQEDGILRHPVSTLVIGVAGLVFFGGLVVVSNTVGENSTTTVWTTLVFLAFALASVPLIADYYFARHRVSEAGMEYGRMFGQRGTFTWSEVEDVRYASGMKWFVIHLQSGSKVRVSAMLAGLPEFARFVLTQVPKTAFDEATCEVLEETAQGRPPSVWS